MGDRGVVHAKHDVGCRQVMLALAKRLARPAPDSVAAHRVADAALWNDQAEPGQAGVVAQRYHFNPPQTPTLAPPEYILKLTGSQQPLLAGKPVTRGRRVGQDQTLLIR